MLDDKPQGLQDAAWGELRKEARVHEALDDKPEGLQNAAWGGL